jgi:hypothetical protein
MAKEPDFLKGLGVENVSEYLKSDDVNRIMADWGNKLIFDLRTKLRKNKTNASGSLSANMELIITPNMKGEKLTIMMNDYWIDVEDGQRPGTKVTSKVILQWMKEKRRHGAFTDVFTKGTNDGLARVISQAIAKKIEARGTKAQPFISTTLKQPRLDKLSQSIADYVAANLFK